MAGFSSERTFREAIRPSKPYGILCDLGIFLLSLAVSAYKHVGSETPASLKGRETECLGGGWWQMLEMPRSLSSTTPLKLAQHHRYPCLCFARLAALLAFLLIVAVSDFRPLLLDRILLCTPGVGRECYVMQV